MRKPVNAGDLIMYNPLGEKGVAYKVSYIYGGATLEFLAGDVLRGAE